MSDRGRSPRVPGRPRASACPRARRQTFHGSSDPGVYRHGHGGRNNGARAPAGCMNRVTGGECAFPE
jgi:hypothetical protein